MQHDLQLRATARPIYDACYPADDQTALSFDEAERQGTAHYREAAHRARTVLASEGEQLILPAFT